MKDSILARARALGAIACFVSGCALEQNDTENTDSTTEALATDVALYTNAAIGSGWSNWSWGTTVSFTGTEIKATSTSAYGALALAHPAGDLAASDYDSISFDVHAPSSGSIVLKLQTLAGATGTSVTIPVSSTTTHQSVKLSTLQGSLGSFGKVDWQALSANQTYYVDNVKIVAKVAATQSSTTYPASPMALKKGDVTNLNSSAGPYSVYVPNSYDATHKTPTKLLLWLHGCGGNAYGDAWATSPGGTQSWVTISIGGRDGGCWDVSSDTTLALAALDDIEKHLNIDRRRVIIGGYSSGGDMAYRTAFYNAKKFAGVLAENTSPFRDTGSSQSSSLGAAAWKFNVVHLAHTGDTTYPIAGVRTETDAVKNAGFPLTRVERAGTHWDAEGTSSGTNYDMRNVLLPYIDAGWLAPAQ